VRGNLGVIAMIKRSYGFLAARPLLRVALQAAEGW